jgi:hypothetical protein
MSDEPTPPIPSLYQWAGGAPAFDRLMEVFNQRVPAAPILAPVFAGMSPGAGAGLDRSGASLAITGAAACGQESHA